MIQRLLIRPGAIGDLIVSLPALESLRADYTEVWCAGQNVPLARFADRAQSIVSAGLDRLGLLPAEDVIERLRRFDSIISWYGTNRPEFRALVEELKLPFQFLPALPPQFAAQALVPAAPTIPLYAGARSPGAGAHAVDYYNAQAISLGAKKPARFPSIACPGGQRTFAVIHPFASNMAKRAPIEVFEFVAARLRTEMPVHWLCGPEEAFPEAVRLENLYDLACWLTQARIYVGNDSGISHLAAAVGTPVQVFFRTTDPKIWSPRGPSVNAIRLQSL